MKTSSSKRPVAILATLSAVLLAAQLWLVGHWLAASSGGRGGPDATREFLRRLPPALAELGPSNLAWLSIVVGFVGFGAAVFAKERASGTMRLVAWALLGANGVLVAWYLFTKM